MADIGVSPLAQMAIRLYGFGAIAYGLLQMFGGIARWGGPAFATLSQIPGAPYSLALIVLVLGICILLGSYLYNNMVRNIGLYGFGVWLLVFATCFVFAIFGSPVVSATTWLGYTLIAIHTFILARSREVEPLADANVARNTRT